MNIDALKIFCDVARLRSFSRSAKVHDITQSAASQAVHALEVRLGVTLIDRSHRPWVLTAAGKSAFDGCRDIVERFEKMERDARGGTPFNTAAVRVAAIYSVGLRHMREFLQSFSASHPAIQVHLEYVHPEKVYEAVVDDRVDVGIVSFPRRGRGWDVIPWRREEMVLATSMDHPWARMKEVGPDRLDGENFVAFDKGLDVRREVDRFLKKIGVGVNVALEFDNIEAIKQAVEIGSGVSLLPSPTLDREIKSRSLAAVGLKGKPFYRPLGILLRHGRAVNPHVDELVKELQRVAVATGNGKHERT